jgi:hypothetical protein
MTIVSYHGEHGSKNALFPPNDSSNKPKASTLDYSDTNKNMSTDVPKVML